MIFLDWVILAVLGVGFVGGFFKGVIRQVFSLGGLILGVVLGSLLYKPFAGFLMNILNIADKTACIVAFILILLVVPIVCSLLGKLLAKVVHASNLGFFDRVLGALFGLFTYMLILGLIIKMLDMTGISRKIIVTDEKRQSRLYQPMSDFTGFCLQWTWNKVQDTAGDLVPEIPKFDGDSNNKNRDSKKV